MHAVSVEALTKHYGDVAAVDRISFSIKSGQVVGLLGPNGAGKTTTLKMLCGGCPPTSGTATVAQHRLADQAQKVRQRVGYLPERIPVYDELSVTESLRFAGQLKGVNGKGLRDRCVEILPLCGLTDVRHQLVATLSKGFRQRVALAQSLMGNPEVLIWDEPTSGLDPTQVKQVRDLIRSLAGQATLLISTHILAEVAAVCDRVLVMHRGKIVGDYDLDDGSRSTESLEEAFSRLTSVEVDVS